MLLQAAVGSLFTIGMLASAALSWTAREGVSAMVFGVLALVMGICGAIWIWPEPKARMREKDPTLFRDSVIGIDQWTAERRQELARLNRPAAKGWQRRAQ